MNTKIQKIDIIIPEMIDLNDHSNHQGFPIYKSLDDFELYRITDKTPIPEPVPIVCVANEIIATVADITAISGPSKAGKTGFVIPVIALGLTPDGTIEDPILHLSVASNENRLAIIHIDTEQARWKHQRNVKAILCRARLETCPEHFLSYNIRQLPLNEYESITLSICKTANEKFGGIHFIVIDGIADYIQDVNDPGQSNAIIKSFEQLAINYNCPIITIIHVNPGSDKERGHLGSHIQRKAGSVLSIKKEGDISYLEPKFLRYGGNGNVPMIQLRYDVNKGYHVSDGIRDNSPQNKDLSRISELKNLAASAFPAPNAFKYQEALESIMRLAHKKERTAKDLFKEMKAHNFINQSGDFWRLNLSLVQ